MGVHILDPKRDSSITKQRLLLATMLVLVLTIVVLGRLYFLQVVKHDRYRTLSVENRIGLLPVPPVRGRIFDRNGEILAENYPVYELEVIPDQTQDLKRTVRELNDLISLSDAELNRFDHLLKTRPSFETTASQAQSKLQGGIPDRSQPVSFSRCCVASEFAPVLSLTRGLLHTQWVMWAASARKISARLTAQLIAALDILGNSVSKLSMKMNCWV